MTYLKVVKAKFGSALKEISDAAAKSELASHKAFPVAGRILVDRDWFAHKENKPPVVTVPKPSTTATAGTPGSFNNDVPANLAALQALGALGNSAAWTAGQYVDLGDGTKASWNGTAWVAGAVPIPTPTPTPPPAPPPSDDCPPKTVAKSMKLAGDDIDVLEVEKDGRVRTKRSAYVSKDGEPAKRKPGRPRKAAKTETSAK